MVRGAKDICRSLINAGQIKPKDVARIMRILNALSDICYEELFKGKPVVLPGHLGTLRIHKEFPKDPKRIPRHRKWVMKGHEYDVNRHCYNPKTGGLVYSFKVTGMDLEKLGASVKMAGRFRKRLFDELYHKDLANTL